MTVANGAYEIEISIAGESDIVTEDAVSFSVKSSIYSLFPTLAMEVNDIAGVLQEGLFFVKGSPIDITFGTKDYLQKCSYTITADNISQFTFPGTLSGKVEIDAIHRWYYEQEIVSKSFVGSGGRAVQNAIATANFSTHNIDDTIGTFTWYWPYIYNSDFIMNTVRPNVVNSTSPKSPYVAFIDTGNNFYFQNVGSYFKNSTIAELHYSPDSTEPLQNGDKNGVLFIRKLHDLKEDFYPTQKNSVFTLSQDQPFIEKEEYDAYYPVDAEGRNIPVMGDSNTITGRGDRLFSPSNALQRRLHQAFLANRYMSSLCIDRFFVAIPLNTSLRPGQAVSLYIHTNLKPDTSNYSEAFSGKYIIESAEHSWIGEQYRGFTYLTVGRRYLDVPSRYALGGRLL